MEPHRREQERAGSGSRSVPASMGLPAISRETEGPDTDIQCTAEMVSLVAALSTSRNPFSPAVELPLGCQAGTVLLGLSQHVTQGNSGNYTVTAGVSHRRGEGALCCRGLALHPPGAP